jgi:hypothetical protein
MEQDILIGSYIESLYITEKFQYLDEGLKDVLSKLTQPVLKSIMPKTFKISASMDLSGFLDLLQKHGAKPKNVKPTEVIDLAKTLPSDIQQGAVFAQKVITNSIPKASKKMKMASGVAISLLAKIKYPKTPNFLGAVKKELKGYIPKIRSFYDEVEDKAGEESKKIKAEDIADLAIAIATVVVLGTLAGLFIWGMFAVVSAFVAVCATMISWLPHVLSSILALWGIAGAAVGGAIIWAKHKGKK